MTEPVAPGPPDPQPPSGTARITARAAPTPSFFARARTSSGDFLRRVWKKADQDQIFFMGGAIAFNVLVAIIPLALAAVGVAGFFLQEKAGGDAASKPVVDYLLSVLPEVSPEFRLQMTEYLNGFIANSAGLFTVGTLIFAWLATRLIGTLRAALREIFDIQQDRSIIVGKLFDLQMVFVAGTLLVLNIAITTAVGLVQQFGFDFLNIAPGQQSFVQSTIATLLAFLTIWFMFVLIYRYLPARRIHWRTAMISATFTAITFELMKAAFAWYFATAQYGTTYGTLKTIAIVIIYVYYSALAFILGGEVGQVAALQRIRRRQKERLV